MLGASHLPWLPRGPIPHYGIPDGHQYVTTRCQGDLFGFASDAQTPIQCWHKDAVIALRVAQGAQCLPLRQQGAREPWSVPWKAAPQGGCGLPERPALDRGCQVFVEGTQLAFQPSHRLLDNSLDAHRGGAAAPALALPGVRHAAAAGT